MPEADLIEALEQWAQLHVEAERLHAALPEETRAAIETAGVDIGGLAAWLATLPTAEREHLRELVYALLHLAQRGGRLNRPRMCDRHLVPPAS
jgi:hypothetical protein